jgi:hypothetical protein
MIFVGLTFHAIFSIPWSKPEASYLREESVKLIAAVPGWKSMDLSQNAGKNSKIFRDFKIND